MVRCATCLRVWLRTCLRKCLAGCVDVAAAVASLLTVAGGAAMPPVLPDCCAANAGPATRVVASRAAARFLNICLSCCLLDGVSLRAAPIVEERFACGA